MSYFDRFRGDDDEGLEHSLTTDGRAEVQDNRDELDLISFGGVVFEFRTKARHEWIQTDVLWDLGEWR